MVELMIALTDPGMRFSSPKARSRSRSWILDLEGQGQGNSKRLRTIQHQGLGLGFLAHLSPGDVNLRGSVNDCGSNSVVRRLDLLPAPSPLKREVQGPQRPNMPKRSPSPSMAPITPVVSRRIDEVVGKELESKLEAQLEPELDDEWGRPVRCYHNPTNFEELESFKRKVANMERAFANAQHGYYQGHAHWHGRQPSSSSELIIQREEEMKAKEKPLYKTLHERTRGRDYKLKGLKLEIELATAKLEALQFAKKEIKSESQIQNHIEAEKGGLWEDDEQHEKDEKGNLVAALCNVFKPLSDDEESDVARALKNLNRSEVLVMHDSSNIEITRNKLQCLLPNGWLNDEVINLYLELLKEREKREPNKYLKCHFFNTFFYKKLYSPMAKKYDYKAVRRWTTQKKIGYSLTDCDKIFVPIHKEIHWCLAIIDIRAKKFQYLDSLKGTGAHVLKVLARYIADEAKDKTGQDVDVSAWEQEVVEDIPEQENGWDCGMFMIKYADFHSRDLPLKFGQEHMPYFRKRTAKEILRLRAE